MVKRKRRRRKQGVVSWVTSIIAIAIGLSGVVTTLKGPGGLNRLANQASFNLLDGGTFNLASGLRVYAPMLGGIVFKKLASVLVKSAKIQSLVPRIG